jgi:hypothetical protein
MNTPTLNAADLHVKTLEYLVDLWDKDLLPEDMKDYVMEEIPILKLLYKGKRSSPEFDISPELLNVVDHCH